MGSSPLSQAEPQAPAGKKGVSELETERSQWALLLCLAMVSFVLSGVFFIFMVGSNRILKEQRLRLRQQVQATEQAADFLKNFLGELAPLSLQHPEIRAILARNGIDVNFQPVSSPELIRGQGASPLRYEPPSSVKRP